MAKKQPLLSIVIPSYNSKATLGKCLESIFASPFKEKEIIVVDDCSTDDSYAIAKSFPCRVLRTKKNSGPATARNTGAEAAKGSIILFLDSDVILHPGALQEVVRSFTKDVAVVSGIYDKAPANRGIVEDYYALLKYYARLKMRGECNFIEAAVGAIRRDIFLAVKYDERFRGAETENEEFAFRLMQFLAKQGKNKPHRMILNRNIVVTHHSPGMAKLVRSFRWRTYLWVKLFMRRRSFETSFTTPAIGLANLAGFSTPFLLVLGVLHPLFFALFAAAAAVFLIGYGSYFLYFLKEKGVLFLLAAIAIAYILSLNVGFGAVRGLFDYFVRGNKSVSS